MDQVNYFFFILKCEFKMESFSSHDMDSGVAMVVQN